MDAKERAKAFYIAHKEEILAYKKEYYIANRSKIREKQAIYYQAHKRDILAKKRAKNDRRTRDRSLPKEESERKG